MNNEEVQQPESGIQEEVKSPVADKLGQLDSAGLSNLLKSGFLDEEEAAPATEEQQDTAEVEQPLSEGEAHTEEESDQPEAEDSSLTRGVQKRINKLVAAKKAAQAELEAHKEKLSQLSKELDEAKNASHQRAPDQSDYADSIESFEKLQEEYNQTVEYLIWCEENADGGTITLPNGEKQDLSDVQVRMAKAAFLRRRDIDLPARFNFLKNQESFNQSASSDFPWWNKPETEEYKTAQLILKDFPEIKRRRPDWKNLIGLVVLGMKTHLSNKTNAGKKQVPIKRAPVQPGVSKAPPSTASSSTDLAKAKERFVKNSDQRGMNDLIKAMGFV